MSMRCLADGRMSCSTTPTPVRDTAITRPVQSTGRYVSVLSPSPVQNDRIAATLEQVQRRHRPVHVRFPPRTSQEAPSRPGCGGRCPIRSCPVINRQHKSGLTASPSSTRALMLHSFSKPAIPAVSHRPSVVVRRGKTAGGMRQPATAAPTATLPLPTACRRA